jgi:hypothetical protein
MEKPPFQLYIRQELFDHLIYPLSTKLDDASIIETFRSLHLKSAIDFKISLQNWFDEAEKNGLSKIEATTLYQTYKIFDSSRSEYSSSSTNSRYEISNNVNSVDVRYFGLFYALQTFALRIKKSVTIEKADKNVQSTYMNNFLNSPSAASPRGKGSNSNRERAQSQNYEYQYLVNYVKSNLKLFLRIIASDIHNTETTINAEEYNTLKFLFKLYDPNDNLNNISTNSIKSNSSGYHKKVNLSDYSACFTHKSKADKINMNTVYESLMRILMPTPPEQNDYCVIRQLEKCVTIKNEELLNKNIHISQCKESYIYINTNVLNCKISSCENCTIVVAAVSKITSFDRCDKCNICVISNYTRISNMIDSNIYLYTAYEPVLFGDNRGLKLGPHNVSYIDLYAIAKESKITINVNGQDMFKNFVFMSTNTNEQATIIKPEEFSVLTVPFESKDFTYKLTPKAYVNALEDRRRNFARIKDMIEKANLNNEQEKMFHLALQGHFRDYLISHNKSQAINTIISMINNPVNRGNEFEEDTYENDKK